MGKSKFFPLQTSNEVMLKNFIDLTRAAMASEMLVQAVACPQLPNQAGALQYLGLFATEQPAKKHKSQTALPPESVIGSNVMNHPCAKQACR